MVSQQLVFSAKATGSGTAVYVKCRFEAHHNKKRGQHLRNYLQTLPREIQQGALRDLRETLQGLIDAQVPIWPAHTASRLLCMAISVEYCAGGHPLWQLVLCCFLQLARVCIRLHA